MSRFDKLFDESEREREKSYVEHNDSVVVHTVSVKFDAGAIMVARLFKLSVSKQH